MKRFKLRIALIACGGLLLGGAAQGGGGGEVVAQTPHPIQPTDPATDNGQSTAFGFSVGLDENLLVVGSPDEDSATEGGPLNSGAVRVFERRGAAWVETQRLTAETETAFEEFGHSVAVARGDDGTDYLVVGVPLSDGSRGRAEVYRRVDAGPWELDATLTQHEPEAGDRFGEDVAIDFFEPPNDPDATGPVFVIAVGAPQNDGPNVSDTDNGSVSIFQRIGGGFWQPTGQEFFGADNSDLLGSSVAIGGPFVVAGATGMDATPSGDGFNSGGGQYFIQANFDGTIYVYAPDKELYPSDGQLFTAGMGLSAASDGAIGVLGAPLHDEGDSAGSNFGKVYIYDLTTAIGLSLVESAVLQPPGLQSAAEFGASVDVSFGILAVGAPGVVPDGAVFIYEIGEDIETWNLVGQLTIPDPVPVESCRGGKAVAIHRETAAAGCPSTVTVQNDFAFVYFGGIFADGFENGFGAWTSRVP